MLHFPHVRESKTVLDSRFHAVESGFQLGTGLQSLLVELGFGNLHVGGIPDSLSCNPDSTNPPFLTWNVLFNQQVFGTSKADLTEIDMLRCYGKTSNQV